MCPHILPQPGVEEFAWSPRLTGPTGCQRVCRGPMVASSWGLGSLWGPPQHDACCRPAARGTVVDAGNTDLGGKILKYIIIIGMLLAAAAFIYKIVHQSP